METNNFPCIPPDVIRLIAAYLEEGRTLEDKIADSLRCRYFDEGFYGILMRMFCENAAYIDITFVFPADKQINPRVSLFDQEVYYLDESIYHTEKRKLPLKRIVCISKNKLTLNCSLGTVSLDLHISEPKLRELFVNAEIWPYNIPRINKQQICRNDVLLLCKLAGRSKLIYSAMSFCSPKFWDDPMTSKLSFTSSGKDIEVNFQIFIDTWYEYHYCYKPSYASIYVLGEKIYMTGEKMIGHVESNLKLLLYLSRENFNSLSYSNIPL